MALQDSSPRPLPPIFTCDRRLASNCAVDHVPQHDHVLRVWKNGGNFQCADVTALGGQLHKIFQSRHDQRTTPLRRTSVALVADLLLSNDDDPGTMMFQ
jgi:hypothetical protein